MVDINNYNRVKRLEERIKEEGLDKLIEGLMKNPYKEKSEFDKVLI